MKLTIDPEFQAFIPPLAPDKLEGLEQELIADGGPREPITVWQHEGQHIIVDGHNRFALCQKHGLSYQVSIKTFFDRAAAKNWMLANQLHRRNITDEQVCMLSALAGLQPPGTLAASPFAQMARDIVGTDLPPKVLSGFFSLRQAHNRWKKATLPPKPKPAVVPKAPAGWGQVDGGATKPDFTGAARAIAMEHGDAPTVLGRGTCDMRATGQGHVMVMPDLHAPFHDVRGTDLFLSAVEAVKPEWLVIIGDGPDCYAASSFDRSPLRAQRLVDELPLYQGLMKRLYQASPNSKFVYVQGNHEWRIDRLLTKVPALHGLISTQELMLKELPGCEWVPYRAIKRIGKVLYTHDLERCGVHAGRDTLLAAGTNVVFGHIHCGGLNVDGDHTGDRRFSLSVGWLGDIKQADYTHDLNKMRRWTLGFGHVYECPETGMLWPSFVPILRDRCYVAGQMVRL